MEVRYAEIQFLIIMFPTKPEPKTLVTSALLLFFPDLRLSSSLQLPPVQWVPGVSRGYGAAGA